MTSYSLHCNRKNIQAANFFVIVSPWSFASQAVAENCNKYRAGQTSEWVDCFMLKHRDLKYVLVFDYLYTIEGISIRKMA